MRTMLIAVVAVLGVGAAVLGPVAIAAPAVSPFAGEYTGQAGEPLESWQAVWGSISISSSGRITGTDPNIDGRFSGTVSAGGTYSLSGSVRSKFGQGHGFFSDVLPGGAETDAAAAKDSAIATTFYFQSNGTLALGADGNLYGTTTFGSAFVWTRK